LERRTVGIAVRVPGGFVFYASDSRFEGLDGQTFPRARTIERELARFAKQQKAAGQTVQHSPAMA
jgi:hypothetical protein